MRGIFSNADARPQVILGFDDAHASDYEAYQYLKGRGITKATAWIVSDLVGTEDKLTVEQMAEMYADGWDLANHTKDHENVNEFSLTQAQCATELTGCKNALDGWGFTRASGFSKFGGSVGFDSSSAASEAAATATGMLTTYHDVGGVMTLLELIPAAPHCAIVANLTGPSDFETPPADLIAAIDASFARGLPIFVGFHKLSDTPSGIEWSWDSFYAVIDYLISRNARFMTMSELYRQGF